ncbi:hypothetical protein FD754_011117 [Muntiacus muntjak]|uniref:BolA family member 3 n=1 Tax=Muntiacus muntjak TaxID=9888 RepID=A0A5N3VAQ9_MUNMU|nr:hypothetical protein FD754_011117 [Muntiacus muntjak]
MGSDLGQRTASAGRGSVDPAAAVPLLHGTRHWAQATAIKVTDISGGCGATYEIKIQSEEFKEKRIVQQHQMVNQVLKEKIKGMHRLWIFTSVPKY